MFKRFAVSFFFIFILQLVSFYNVVEAGFGITPPYVSNTSLTRSSVYEQQILMVRSNPNEDLRAVITVDAPEIEEWIEIIEGQDILLPAGQQKIPMTVRVTVPSGADFRAYTGAIRIKTTPADETSRSGAVSISLGAQVDINLNVIDKEILDFRVRKIGISDLNEGHKVAWLYYPGKILFDMMVENTGNVDVAPSKVEFKIYDSQGSVLLEEITHSNRIAKVEPFATETITAELPTRLPAGSYLARYAIYNEDEIKQEGELTLSILPYGTLQVAGYGFFGLSVPHKISIVLPIVTIFILFGLAYRMQRRRNRS